MATKNLYLYPIWIRSWHIVNALTFLLLIVSGISMHFSTSGKDVIGFKLAVSMHNVAAIIITINYGIFLVGNIMSKNGGYYRKWRKNLSINLWRQLRFYSVGIFKDESHPFPVTEKQKFNPLQKFAYVLVMYFGMPLLIVTGIGLFFPEWIAYNIFGVSGLIFTDILHHIVGFVLSVFLLIHIYTCTLGDKPGTLFKSMITGYHEEHEEHG